MSNPFKETEEYNVIQCSSRNEWLEQRKQTIGGSEASAFMDCGYKSVRDVWIDKFSNPKECTNDAMMYGIMCENPLRVLFREKHHELSVFYKENVLIKSKLHKWASYSPDGLLYEKETGRYGILEIKTRLSQGYLKDMEAWGTADNPCVPDAYYWQVIHGLMVTGFDFVYITCEIRYSWTDDSKIIVRKIEREDVLEDIEMLRKTEQEAWEKYFLTEKIPPMKIIF